MGANVIAGLDIGSTKTCAVLAEVVARASGPPEVKILGVGQSRTAGVRRDAVTDIDGTTESVRSAMKEAELMAGTEPVRLFAGIAGEHIEAYGSTGVVAVGGEEIRADDVRRVQEVARAVRVPEDREVLHVLPQEYIIDQQPGIRDPAGMAGTRLEAEVFIITSRSTAGQNLRKAVRRAGYDIDALVYEPLATADAVLSEDERDLGVALIDLGGAATETLVYREGKARHIATVPWGGAAITNDLAKGLSIPYGEAERTKERWGIASAQRVDPRETIEVPGPAPGTTKAVARELVAHIIEQRLDEILGLVAREIEEAGELDELRAGVVLTGGGASLEGTTDVAQHVFSTPVRVGVPGPGLTGLTDSIRGPKYAAAAGLALYGAGRTAQISPVRRIGEGAVGRVVRWLKEFF